MSAMSTPTESLTLAEVRTTLQGLSAADWKRVKSFARLRAAGLPDWTAETLLAEAVTELWAGQRVWRRGVGAVTTIANVMRSVASNERKKRAGAPIDPFTMVDAGAGTEDGEPQGVIASDERSPLAIADSRSQIAAIDKLLGDDEDARLVLMAWADGLRGKVAAADLDFDMKRYDAARKRLEHRLAPLKNLRKEK